MVGSDRRSTWVRVLFRLWTSVWVKWLHSVSVGATRDDRRPTRKTSTHHGIFCHLTVIRRPAILIAEPKAQNTFLLVFGGVATNGIRPYRVNILEYLDGSLDWRLEDVILLIFQQPREVMSLVFILILGKHFVVERLKWIGCLFVILCRFDVVIVVRYAPAKICVSLTLVHRVVRLHLELLNVVYFALGLLFGRLRSLSWHRRWTFDLFLTMDGLAINWLRFFRLHFFYRFRNMLGLPGWNRGFFT